jgi:hypothetical protein
LFALTRNQYLVPRDRFAVVNVVTLAATLLVTSDLVNVEFLAIWIVKPVSLLALSAQVNVALALLLFITVPTAVTPDGAAGTVKSTVTVFDGTEVPATAAVRTAVTK